MATPTDPRLPPLASLITGIRRRWEQIRLRVEPKIAVEPSRLRIVTRDDLSEALSPTSDTGWNAASAALAGISTTAIRGGVNPGDRRALYDLVRYLDPKAVLEIGTHVGASTLHLAQALRVDRDTDGKSVTLTTVDVLDVNEGATAPWRKLGLPQSPRKTLEAHGLSELVHFVRDRSEDFLLKTNETYDLVFVDGLHTAVQTYRDIALSLGRLRDGGTILLHDYFPDLQPLWTGKPPIVGPYLAVRRLMAETSELDVCPVGDLPWETKLGSQTTSLALLSRRTAH